MSDIIQAKKVNRAESSEIQNCSQDLEKKSCSEHGRETLCLCGEQITKNFQENGIAGKVSSVQCSEMNPSTKAATLSDRLTPLLISAGLVKGIIPTSMRDASGQQTLDSVLKLPDGERAEPPKED